MWYKIYKQAIYISKKLEKEQRIGKIAELELSDPKSFWKELKALITPKDNAVDLIDKEEWSAHFTNLLNVPPASGTDKQFLNYIKASLPTIERESLLTPNDFLNKRIVHKQFQLKASEAIILLYLTITGDIF